MNKIISWFLENFSNMVRFILFVLSIYLIVLLFPRETGFYQEFSQARPWMYEDLIAPFDFAILKSQEEINRERQEIIDEFTPFYERDQGVYETQFQQLIQNFEIRWRESFSGTTAYTPLKDEAKNAAIALFDSIYKKGIIFLEGETTRSAAPEEILLRDGSVAKTRDVEDFFTIRQAFETAEKYVSDLNFPSEVKSVVQYALESSLTHSVVEDEETNNMALENALSRISRTRGLVQQGEKIISQGELITAEKMRILESFRTEYGRQLGSASQSSLIFWGQFLLVSISILVLSLFLKEFRKEVFNNTRKLVVILLTIYLMVFLTSQVVKYDLDLLYLLPVCIVPIIIRSFFDNRLALYVHITSIILIGFLVPRSFEFVFIQFIAGIIAILSMASLRRREQLFFTVSLIFLTYSAVYTGLLLAQTGSFENIEPIQYLYFLGGATLTLLSYPLIYVFERTSGLPTDFSLLELSDTNNKLLRELNLSAPGTFQHSLQVANMAEEAINTIGGNSLLIRTGAMYHDIGKMDQPHFFTENQNAGINPHDDISYAESAEIIIGHVIKGIEKARKYNLPEYLIDFIRTHHGTTTTRYFYVMEQKDNPDKEIDKEVFTYKGPKPFSKETAVLMMADSVEAASRSLKKPDEKSISGLIDNIIDTQIEENQFDNADITFKDITTIKKVFKNRMMHIFHVRIAYPVLN